MQQKIHYMKSRTPGSNVSSRKRKRRVSEEEDSDEDDEADEYDEYEAMDEGEDDELGEFDDEDSGGKPPNKKKRKLMSVEERIQSQLNFQFMDRVKKPVWADGKIRRITLHNFMCYDDATLRPAPGLNLLVGHNEAGKSTIVCAICLALGGRPNVIVKSKNVVDFVKTGCREAWVEIELFRENRDNLIIRRTIKRGKKKRAINTWSMNRKLKQVGDVREKIRKMGIDFTNLTQFLPQDRVKSFANLSKRQRLQCTQKSILTSEELKFYEELIGLQKGSFETERIIAEKEKILEVEETKLKHMEKAVQQYKMKRKLLRKLKELGLKLTLIRLYKLLEMDRPIRNQLNEAKMQYNRHVINERQNQGIQRIDRVELASLRRKVESMQANYERGTKKLLRETKAKALEEKDNLLKENEEESKSDSSIPRMTTDDLKNRLMEFPGDEETVKSMILKEQFECGKLIGNVRSLEEFNTQLELVKEMQTRLIRLKGDYNRIDVAEIERKERSWWNPLKRKVDTINDNFRGICKRVGIAGGEISLKINRFNYENSMLEIKVRFQDSESLADLHINRHSGGECSVATILFILAMQSQGKSPFFIVDEINSEMDSVNERRVFEEMVGHANKRNVPQSFFITPKLLSGLIPEDAEFLRIFFFYNSKTNVGFEEANKFTRKWMGSGK